MRGRINWFSGRTISVFPIFLGKKIAPKFLRLGSDFVSDSWRLEKFWRRDNSSNDNWPHDICSRPPVWPLNQRGSMRAKWRFSSRMIVCCTLRLASSNSFYGKNSNIAPSRGVCWQKKINTEKEREETKKAQHLVGKEPKTSWVFVPEEFALVLRYNSCP